MAPGRWDRLLTLGMVGTVLTCIACFTPGAVAILTLVGLAGWAGYLDSVLFPLLGFFVMLIGYGVWQRRREGRRAQEPGPEPPAEGPVDG